MLNSSNESEFFTSQAPGETTALADMLITVLWDPMQMIQISWVQIPDPEKLCNNKHMLF